MEPARISLLVGPKGAGKTTLALRIEAELGIPFVRVEPIWLALAAEKAFEGPAFDAEGQQRVLAEVGRRLSESGRAVLESTGTAPWFASFVARLRALGEVELVKVSAPRELCLERVRNRDPSAHIPVSDDRVEQINRLTEAVDLPWSEVLENLTQADADAFIARRAGAGSSPLRL